MASSIHLLLHYELLKHFRVMILDKLHLHHHVLLAVSLVERNLILDTVKSGFDIVRVDAFALQRLGLLIVQDFRVLMVDNEVVE